MVALNVLFSKLLWNQSVAVKLFLEYFILPVLSLVLSNTFSESICFKLINFFYIKPDIPNMRHAYISWILDKKPDSAFVQVF